MGHLIIKKLLFACLVLVFLQITLVSGQQSEKSGSSKTIDLSNIFESGYILQDTNGDSITDYVNTSIIVPENPSETIIACGANITARLGYETSGINLDIINISSTQADLHLIPKILISVFPGKNNTIFKDGLAPGQGRIFFYKPNQQYSRGAIIIAGYDDTGLMAAANFFAGRYPDLWKLKGKTFSDLRQNFEKLLNQNNLNAQQVLITSIDIDHNKPGILKLGVEINFTDLADFEQGKKILNNETDKKETEKDKKLLKVSDLHFQDVHKITVKLSSPDSNKTILLLPKKSWGTKLSATKSPSPKKLFSLLEMYSIKGLFQDNNKDFIPDNVPASISMGTVNNANSIANITTRIGLESAGIKIPLVRIAGEEDFPDKYGFPVLFGQNHYLINKLIKNNRLISETGFSNSGYIQFIPKAFKDKNAIVISGDSQQGLNSISDYVSKKLPYLWDYGKGNFLLQNIEDDVQDFFQTRKAAGQVVLALYKVETWLKQLKTQNIDSIQIDIAAQKTPPALKNFTKDLVKKQCNPKGLKVNLYPTGFGTGMPIFEQELEIPWEVDDFWNSFRSTLMPKITVDSRGEIQVIVSESPEIREQIKSRIEKELNDKGVAKNGIKTTVLCAYKQGFSWLQDKILPQITGKIIGKIEIFYHQLDDSKEIRWQTINAKTRWLQEIYPIDVLFARQLNIPDSLITFHPTLQLEPIYTIKVFDKKDKIIFSDSFTPKYVIRPFFDLFPEYESVRVTTGWFTANINNQLYIDQRIKTDPERFWDFLQTVIYKKIINYVMDIQEGRPASSNAPYFDEFKVYLTLSEPNYKIGVDEEVISSVEALHEDIYFETLTLFNLIGGRYGAGSMNFPGRIIPLIQPPVDGRPGKAKFVFTGKQKARPHIVMAYKYKNQEPVKKSYYLNNLNIPKPRLSGIWVEPNQDKVSQLMFDITANDSIDRQTEYRFRSSESRIDQAIVPIGKLTDMVKILAKLHKNGIFEDYLSYDRVKNILFRISLEDSVQFTELVKLSVSDNPKSTKNPKLFAGGYSYKKEQIVQWDNPIDPDEAANIMAKLNTFPNINVYYTVNSFLDQPIFAMDLIPQYKSKYISQAKLTALKPTLFISGRQHANEVSSTSHILRLAELVATDPMYTKYLDKVNLVLHPIANIDGARLGVKLHKQNPDFMLHAAYLGPLGVDIDRGSGHYPETKVRQQIRETWLPDVYLNPHGYPSHEWVQYFAGYSAWVRNRNGGQRSWWSPRGWFIPGFRWIEDKKYPEFKKVSFAILDSIAAAITSLPEVMAVNRSMYNRYRKYGIQDLENFREHFFKGILVYQSIKGTKLTDTKITGPKITYFSLTTEAPDETASGDWLKMVCRAGLAHTRAVLNYLSTGKNRINYETKEYQYSISRSVFRKRPVLPYEKKKSEK